MGETLDLGEIAYLEKETARMLKQKESKQKKYKICSIEYPRCILMDSDEMIEYAKKQLSFNKKVHGLDKSVSSADLSNELNAWSYLNNVGLADKIVKKRR